MGTQRTALQVLWSVHSCSDCLTFCTKHRRFELFTYTDFSKGMLKPNKHVFLVMQYCNEDRLRIRLIYEWNNSTTNRTKLSGSSYIFSVSFEYKGGVIFNLNWFIQNEVINIKANLSRPPRIEPIAFSCAASSDNNNNSNLWRCVSLPDSIWEWVIL